ncbi:hypothetical protein Natpe_1859 [Natrinema pellirubrum DSM 15624]|uniref:Uncharacterized protein n=1 Tax=Natrinema pellirubrum (strain DSM 15624 / CIP 106293 / JCM 10476 / NCIMB 786 / 157) TaxID=797303 RepID=L0JMX5_NATP1|nr:hypothetical protein Natpe_1859 [Natrinema pellirubrum DSM 15624]
MPYDLFCDTLTYSLIDYVSNFRRVLQRWYSQLL